MIVRKESHWLRTLLKVALIFGSLAGLFALTFLPILEISRPEQVSLVMLTKTGGVIVPVQLGEEFDEMTIEFCPVISPGVFTFEWPGEVNTLLGDCSVGKILNFDLADRILGGSQDKEIQFENWDNLSEEPYQVITVKLERASKTSINIALRGSPLTASNVSISTQYVCTPGNCTLTSNSWVRPVNFWDYID